MAKAPAKPPKRRGPKPTRATSGPTSGPVDWDAFLVALREVPFVRRACERVGVSRSTADQKRREDAEFAACWADAIDDSWDTLATSIFVRAVRGWKAGRCERCAGTGRIDGERCTDCRGRGRDTTDRPSDDLAKFLLRHHRPETYGKVETLNVSVRPVIRLKIAGDDASDDEPTPPPPTESPTPAPTAKPILRKG